MEAAVTRKTNPEIIAEFAALITEGAKQMAAEVACEINGIPHDIGSSHVLEATKAWRTDIWRKLKECEERMCPRPPERTGDDQG